MYELIYKLFPSFVKVCAAIFAGFFSGASIGNSIGTKAANDALLLMYENMYKTNSTSENSAPALNKFNSTYNTAWNTAVTVCTLSFATMGVIEALRTYRNRNATETTQISKQLKAILQSLTGALVSIFIGTVLADSLSTRAAQDKSRTYNNANPNAPLLEKMRAYTNTLSISWLATMIPCVILGTVITMALVYREYNKPDNSEEQTPLLQPNP